MGSDRKIAEFSSLVPPDLAVVARRPAETSDSMLYPAERELLPVEPAPAQFTAGRVCAHLAMARFGVSGAVLRQPDGAPAWPPGLRGSIAHKERLAIAAAGRSESVAGVGIDVEEARALPASVWSSVLTQEIGRAHV